MKKLLSMLLVVSMLLGMFCMTAASAEPTRTYTTVDLKKSAWLNTFENMNVSDHSNKTYNQTYNYVLAHNENRGDLVLYMSFDITGLTDGNVVGGRILTSMGGGMKGQNFSIYKLDPSLWNDTVGPVIDRSVANTVTSITTPAEFTTITENIPAGYSYNTEFDVSSAILSAVKNNQSKVCLILERTSGGYSTFGNDKSKSIPRLQIITSDNHAPTVELKSDKTGDVSYGSDVTITAEASDADGDDMTYEFKVNGTVNTDDVSGNQLTLRNLGGGTYTVSVTVTDTWGNVGTDSITFTVKDDPTPKKTAGYIKFNAIKCGYDGKNYADFNHSNVLGNSYNFALSHDSGKGYCSVYTKFNISGKGLSESNISSARLLTGMGGGQAGANIAIYSFDSDKWSDTTAPIIDRSAANTVAAGTNPSPMSSTTVNDGTRDIVYNSAFDITDFIKEKVSEGVTEFGIVIERTSNGYSTYSKENTNIEIVTTTNCVPAVTLSADKTGGVDYSKPVVITANATDTNEEGELTYEFFLDGEAADSSAVSGNVLTLTNLASGTHVIKVKVTDSWNDYGIASLKISDKVTEVTGTVSGSIGAGKTLGTNYNVSNYSSDELNFNIIIAIYNSDGSLYDAMFAAKSLAGGNTANFSNVSYTFADGADTTGLTACAYIWEKNTLTPLAEQIDY